MCILRGTCNSRGAYNRSDQQRRIPAEYLDYLGRIYFWFTGGCAITWGARGGGGGWGGGAYKRQFTVFLIVIIEAIYTREPR